MGFVLWAAYRYLRFGLATRAAAGNEKGAVLLGFSPQTLAAINWVIASVLATLSVIIVGPIAGTITPVGLTALIVPALAAALIGGLRSIPIAVAGGLALGAVQTLLDVKKVTWFDGSLAWMQTGVRNFLPLVVIIVVLYARGKSLPIRGAVEEKRLPIAPDPRRVWEHAFFWIVVLTLMAFVFEDAGGRTRFANSMQTGLVVSIVMLSIVLITGYTGQISLAQMSFAGIAAFVMARMMADGIGRGSNLVPVEGPGLALADRRVDRDRRSRRDRCGRRSARRANTWRAARRGDHRRRRGAAGPVLRESRDHPTACRRPGIREGSDDLRDRRRRPERREQNENPAFVIFGAIVLALCAIAVANMRRSGVGRRFLAVRANERAAASAGINVTRTKLLAFAISAAIAGIGGLMLGFKQVEVSSANFAYGASLSVLAFAYLAGISSISGAIVAGMLLQALVPTTSNYFFAGTNIDNYVGLLSGIGIIVTAIVHPEGVAPFFTEGVRHLGNWIGQCDPGGRDAAVELSGPKQVLVKVGLAILVVGTALWLYNAKFIESVEWWVFLSMVLLFLVTLAFARVVGPISPTFGEAGHVWASAAQAVRPDGPRRLRARLDHLAVAGGHLLDVLDADPRQR